ncbi:hypothetical protein HQ545_06870 [Candidatus Woesearchaeota archaeon]|nr:hypothetical protein [Candidatus Woesearchaeota archaeon]
MNETNELGKNLPEKKFRAGSISATIWRNNIKTKDGRDAEFMNVTFLRHYKDDKTEEWKTSNSLRTMDLPKAVVVLNKAYEYIVLNSQGDLAISM